VQDGSPRFLTIMGSGETSPTMVKVHRTILSSLGPNPEAVLLDTPFGFQENADELCAKAASYFAESLNTTINVASYRSASDLGSLGYENALAKLRAASYVFAGPGSPSYALKQWSSSLIPRILADKLESGGAVTFASAAATTLGAFTAPIYEIYKVGEQPRWLEGLDLLHPATGLSAAVIPHFDNAEGGTHDTRYCYLGERRLAMMEEWLPDEAIILGIDEHTGCIFDLGSGTAEVVGRGSVTVRKNGIASIFPTGTKIEIDKLTRAGHGSKADSIEQSDRPWVAPSSNSEVSSERSPYLSQVRECEGAFRSALSGGEVQSALKACLDLEQLISDWTAETFSSDERQLSHQALRQMMLELGSLAEVGAKDPRMVVGPFVEALLDARTSARTQKRFEDSDHLRDLLDAAGVEVRDTPDGATWQLR